MNKLPKQWKHWCKLNRLGTMGRTKKERSQYSWCYLIGRGHVWRLNCHNMLQRGDTIEEFDRWALCQDIFQEPMPQTLEEFTNFVKKALHVTA